MSTFQDYLADYERVLHPSLRDILVEELADELLAHYLSAVRNRGAKFRRSDPFVEKIKDDVLTAFNFFESYHSFPEIKTKWRAVDGFVKLLEADKSAVPAIYESVKGQYWDVQMGWIEAVLRARDDFERSMLNAVGGLKMPSATKMMSLELDNAARKMSSYAGVLAPTVANHFGATKIPAR